jgi:DNA invertase Pin-like site-specific DNA recombinase
LTKGTPVIAYTRVSTERQGESGAGLTKQRQDIEAAALSRGWDLIAIYEEVESGGKRDRPALAEAVGRLKAGEADALVVAKYDRVARSLAHFAELLEQAHREKWALVALDTDVDTTTASGEFVASMIGAAARYERRLIGERTRDGMAVKKQQGRRFGRPVLLPEDVRQRIAALRGEGLSLRAIGRVLEAEGIPTAQGAKSWHVNSIRLVLRSVALDEELAANRIASGDKAIPPPEPKTEPADTTHADTKAAA